jgi:hypothetical protein
MTKQQLLVLPSSLSRRSLSGSNPINRSNAPKVRTTPFNAGGTLATPKSPYA